MSPFSAFYRFLTPIRTIGQALKDVHPTCRNVKCKWNSIVNSILDGQSDYRLALQVGMPLIGIQPKIISLKR